MVGKETLKKLNEVYDKNVGFEQIRYKQSSSNSLRPKSKETTSKPKLVPKSSSSNKSTLVEKETVSHKTAKSTAAKSSSKPKLVPKRNNRLARLTRSLASPTINIAVPKSSPNLGYTYLLLPRLTISYPANSNSLLRYTPYGKL